MTADRTCYFISDLHLGEPTSEIQKTTYREIESFFDAIAAPDAELFILGDFFDFYFEYRTAVPKQCIRGLRFFYHLSSAGVNVHFFAGNHDAWIGDFLSSEFGAHIHDNEARLVRHGLRFYLSHGDGRSRLDRRYRRVRKILRNPINRFLYRWLHPDIGVPLANRLSHASKQRDRYYEKYIGDESFFPWLEKEFANGTDVIMMGHHHIPQERVFPNQKLYINLGDWIRHFTYAKADADGVRLERWKT